MQRNIGHIEGTGSFGRCRSKWSYFVVSGLSNPIGNLAVCVWVVEVVESCLSVYFTFRNERFCFFIAGQVNVAFLFEFLDGFFLDVADVWTISVLVWCYVMRLKDCVEFFVAQFEAPQWIEGCRCISVGGK